MLRVILAALLASLTLCPSLRAAEDVLSADSLAEFQALAKDHARLEPSANFLKQRWDLAAELYEEAEALAKTDFPAAAPKYLAAQGILRSAFSVPPVVPSGPSDPVIRGVVDGWNKVTTKDEAWALVTARGPAAYNTGQLQASYQRGELAAARKSWADQLEAIWHERTRVREELRLKTRAVVAALGPERAAIDKSIDWIARGREEVKRVDAEMRRGAAEVDSDADDLHHDHAKLVADIQRYEKAPAGTYSSDYYDELKHRKLEYELNAENLRNKITSLNAQIQQNQSTNDEVNEESAKTKVRAARHDAFLAVLRQIEATDKAH
jgi:hypothetical protein